MEYAFVTTLPLSHIWTSNWRDVYIHIRIASQTVHPEPKQTIEFRIDPFLVFFLLFSTLYFQNCIVSVAYTYIVRTYDILAHMRHNVWLSHTYTVAAAAIILWYHIYSIHSSSLVFVSLALFLVYSHRQCVLHWAKYKYIIWMQTVNSLTSHDMTVISSHVAVSYR